MKDPLAREKALSVLESFIVHAPAGSGKTDLLVKRYLSLLKTVKNPEEIIAITFTKKAAFEMKERILKALGTSILPSRLRILTIDALSAKLARSMPMESGFGEFPEIAKDPEILYRKAARRLIQDEPWTEAFYLMARHLQNQLGLLENLLVDMLSKREQWLETLMSAKHYSSDLRAFLEGSLASVCEEVRSDFLKHSEATWREEMETLFNFVLNQSGQSFSDWTRESLQAFSHLCLTKTGTLRKMIDKRSGFPTEFPEMKARMKDFLETVESHQAWVDTLQKAQYLPEVKYSDKDWALIQALLEVLPVLVAHLQVVFGEHAEVDFSEVALRALHALGEVESPSDLALKLDYQIRHILVDEFQDTSPTQFRLIEALVRGWEAFDGRTLFLVGDPMQSIYRFRQADVRLFHTAMERGVGDVVLNPIYLASNFRSAPSLVDFCNQVFSRSAQAVHDFSGEVVGYASAEGKEAENLIQVIRKLRLQSPEDSIAILGRSRSQVTDILSKLSREGIPAEAVDMRNLAETQVIRDLCSLLYAFSEAKDLLSWCAFLRTPWVGLSLEGLLHFSQAFHSASQAKTCPEILHHLKAERVFQHSRVSLLLEVYENFVSKILDLPFALGLFEAFHHLGGGLGLKETQEAYAIEQFFRLLEEFSPWEVPDRERLQYALSQRFVRAESLEKSVQVMTIHKSKGLEFDHVFVPALQRMSTRDDLSLLLFQERLSSEGWQLMLAPIKSPKGESSALYRYLYQEEQRMGAEENLRVLYVAATRAKKTLHFSFSFKNAESISESTEFKPLKGSFLEQLYPFVHWQLESDLGDSSENIRRSSTSFLHRIRPEKSSIGLNVSAVDLSKEEGLNHPDWPSFSNLEDRAVGTLVHRYFSRWVKLKKLPNSSEIRSYQAAISAALIQLGVKLELLSASVQRVLEALLKTVISQKAPFLFLNDHEDSHSEYQVSKKQGHLIHFYVMDRTFIDQDIRFIIDYKVAQPREGEDSQAFFQRLRKEYQAQLLCYAELLREKGENRQIKTGLFLPLQDEWVWVYPSQRQAFPIS